MTSSEKVGCKQWVVVEYSLPPYDDVARALKTVFGPFFSLDEATNFARQRPNFTVSVMELSNPERR